MAACFIIHRVKKVFSNILIVLTLVFSFSLYASAATSNGAADITDLMGQRPSNSYYQNPSTSSQTQGTASVLDSAGTSVLQQPATGELKVIGPAVATTPATEVKSSNWHVFAILVAIFFVASIALLVLKLRNRKPVKQVIEPEPPKVKKVIVKDAPETTKNTALSNKKTPSKTKKASNKKRGSKKK